MPKVRHNKQHDTRAASFLRIAKGLRAQAKEAKKDGATNAARFLVVIARENEAEAKRLRSMR